MNIMKNNKIKLTTTAVCFLALAAALNLVGGFIALSLRLPIYLDSIGTMLAATLLGPICGMLPGLVSGLVSGFTSDIYALYYIPVQLLTGIVFRKMQPRKWRLIPAAALISIPGTVVSSTITAVVFGGITSSGSTILVQLLSHTGLSMTASVCVVQALTDYADRVLSLMLTVAVMAAIPSSVKNSIWKGQTTNGTV